MIRILRILNDDDQTDMSNPLKKYSVWIVDDDSDVLFHLSERIRSHPELLLRAVHMSRKSALEWLDHESAAVDALLCDLGLPDGPGQDVIRAATQKWPHCDAMVISMFGDEVSVLSSVAAGAVGYILKDAAWEDVSESILAMKAGGAPMSPMIARGVLSKLRDLPKSSSERPEVSFQHSDDPAGEPSLSAKEREVLDLIARGFTYSEIAQLLRVSIHTVQSHIKNLYRKMAVHSRSEAVFEAQRSGILRDK